MYSETYIHDENADSPGSSSNSSYVPPDSIVGYKCDLSMCKLSRKDVPKALLPVEGKTLATLIADAEEQAALHRLSPLDLERRLYLSCIFSVTSLLINTDDDIAELPSTISQSILALKLAIQHKKLYVQPRPSTTFEELCLNNILFSTFTGHGKPSIKNNFNEIHLIANSLAYS